MNTKRHILLTLIVFYAATLSSCYKTCDGMPEEYLDWFPVSSEYILVCDALPDSQIVISNRITYKRIEEYEVDPYDEPGLDPPYPPLYNYSTHECEELFIWIDGNVISTSLNYSEPEGLRFFLLFNIGSKTRFSTYLNSTPLGVYVDSVYYPDAFSLEIDTTENFDRIWKITVVKGKGLVRIYERAPRRVWKLQE